MATHLLPNPFTLNRATMDIQSHDPSTDPSKFASASYHPIHIILPNPVEALGNLVAKPFWASCGHLTRH